MSDNLALRIDQVLAEEIRPALSSHAGSLTLTAIRDGRAHLKMIGSCAACYFRRGCVANLVIPTLEAQIPGVKYVIDNARI